MIRYVAVIDLGKTNSKVAIVDTLLAEEIHIVKAPAAVNSTGLYPCLDHLAIEAFIIDSLAQLAAVQSIDAITVTTHGATAALVDSSGELALPVVDYEFQEIDALRTTYDKHRPLFRDTGSPALPGGLNIGAQLFWQQATYPTQFANAQTMLTWPQYWVYRLTGQRHNDVTSIGCHTDLYEPRRQRYSSLVNDMGWHSLMPPLQHSGQLSGCLIESLASQTGLPAGLPVYTGIHDSNASLVPHLLNQEQPFSVVSTGTWFIVMASGGNSVELDEQKDTLLNVNAKGEHVPSARFMGGRERDLLAPSSHGDEKALLALLSNKESPAMIMPSVVTDTGPYPAAKFCWSGESTDHNDGLRDSAISLYLAMMAYECMLSIGSAGPTFIEGPLAQDNQFAQMLAAVSQRPVMISGSQTGTSVGAAMLINGPATQPVYELVNLDSDRRNQLTGYAQLWKQLLEDHAK